MKKIFFMALVLLVANSCNNKSQEAKNEAEVTPQANTMEASDDLPKFSLAQWSLHQRYQAKGANPFNFAKDAKAMDFEAIEYVTQLYEKQIEKLGFDAVIDSLQFQNEKHGVICNLIMVDHEGDLADPDPKIRDEAVAKHKKWVDAAARLGGHSVRVNTFGTNDPAIWINTVQDGLKKLSEYAATKNINVIAENHGWLSSNPTLVMEAINGVNMANCGTLPDFGNWCTKRKNNERWGTCIEEYPDRYEGIRLMMPKAKAVSAKAYEFDSEGNETKIDYYKMMQIVKDAGYRDYIGIEFEGSGMTEEEGILATKALVIKAYQQAN